MWKPFVWISCWYFQVLQSNYHEVICIFFRSVPLSVSGLLNYLVLVMPTLHEFVCHFFITTCTKPNITAMRQALLPWCKDKGQHMTCLCRHRGELELQPQTISSLAWEGGGWSAPHSNHFTPGKDRMLIVQEAGWTSGPVWPLRKLTPRLGFDLQTVQPVVSRCTDLAVPTTVAKCPCHMLYRLISWLNNLSNATYSVQPS